MRKRIFVPETPAHLEGRALLSGGLHLHHGAVPLSAPLFNVGLLQVKGYFQQFAIGGDLNLLRSQLQQNAKTLPFNQADQLGPKTNMILNQMEANAAAGSSGAITMAYRQTVGGIKASIIRHIQNGTVVVIDK